jgi:hypothetical protein
MEISLFLVSKLIYSDHPKQLFMKKVLFFSAFLVLYLIFEQSCSKKNAAAPACQLITISDVNGSTTTTYNITYNNEGKISTLQSISGSTTTSKVFTYSGNVIFVTTTYSGSVIQTTDSIVVNSAGLITSDQTRSGTNQSLTTYTYSGNQLLKSILQNNSNPAVTTTYTFTNGDLTGSTDGTTNTTYSYNTSKASAPGDYFQLVQLIQYGASFVINSHQIIGYQIGSTIENITYTYDNTGKVTGLIGTTGGNIETITLQYNCN